MSVARNTVVDMTGQVFGRLTVVRRDTDRTNRSGAVWVCRCECGNTKSVIRGNLISGQIRSCGCLLMGDAKRVEGRVFGVAIEYPSGTRFGSLVVESRAPSRSGKAMFYAQCDCGELLIVSGLYLRSSSHPSCGCIQHEQARKRRSVDLSGQRFGKLVAVSMCGKDTSGHSRWRCKCDCGGEKVVSLSNLRSGRTISCGCARADGSVWMPESARKYSLQRGAIRRAMKRGASGAFTEDEVTALYSQQRGLCASCGKPLGKVFERDHIMPLSKGGSNWISNIQLLCRPCNGRKNAKDPIAWANENGRLC